MNLSKPSVLVFALIAILATIAVAQAPPDSGAVVAGAAPLAPAKDGVMTMHVENDLEVPPVKGAPFCATVTTEHTQSFADGNRIHTSDNSSVCRDSQGRTRREASLNLLAAGQQASAPKLITIDDPVDGVRYMLHPENKIAHRINLSAIGPAGMPGADLPPKGERMLVFQNAAGPGPQTFSTNVLFANKVRGDRDEQAPATENLGEQMINGIHATGTRITTTIPSGKMGNANPINVKSERWYSPELKATVMTKHIDPWAGELKTEFTNINTSEPDPSLFTVPGDYKIVDDRNGPIRIQLPVPAPQ